LLFNNQLRDFSGHTQVLFREKMVGCMLFIHGEGSGLNMRK